VNTQLEKAALALVWRGGKKEN